MSKHASLVCVAFLVASSVAHAQSSEICGNGSDDNSNGMTDEGCWNLTSGQCESPLSCEETGSVSPKKGTLRYALPPDIAPKVPWGPGIGFRRAYLSQYEPGSGSEVWKRPLGDHWHHTYMTWLKKTGTGSSAVVVLHTSQGQDVRAPYDTVRSDSTWNYFKPQIGVHYDRLRQRVASPNEFEVRLLTGETLIYNSSGQLTEVWDTVASPNTGKVLLTYDGNGQVSTVTDASNTRQLLFSYNAAIGRLTSIAFRTKDGAGSWATQHTTSFDYSNGVTTDATSNWFAPANSGEWTKLLQGTGLSNPGSAWLMQETSGSLADAIGSANATIHGSVTYQVTTSGWTRKGVKVTTDNSSSYVSVPSSNPNTTSLLFAQVYALNTNPSSGFRGLNCIGTIQYEEAELINGIKMRGQSGSNTASGTQTYSAAVVVVTKLDHSRNEFAVYTDKGETLKPTFLNQSTGTDSILLGDGVNSSDATLLYAALFSGTAAELSDAQVATLIARMKSGPGLSSVTIGGQLAQKYTYGTNGELTQITDGAGTLMTAFKYSSTTLGQVDLIQTPRGYVGFEYASSRSTCSGNTVLYFNRGNSTSCSVDSDCGSGFLCGGKTGTGTTGTCFRAARCLTVSSPSEDVVTNVAAIGPAPEPCDGACAEVSQYVWNTSAGTGIPVLDQRAVQDGAGNWVTRTFDSAGTGLVTGITYGDLDSEPGGGNREVYFYYKDTSFPGRVTEIRRKSDLSDSASQCNSNYLTGTNGCARIQYTYNSDGLLSTIVRSGTTFNASADRVGYTATTTFTYDAHGRLTRVDGPLSGSDDVTDFEYWTSSSVPSKEGLLQNLKRKKDASNYIVTAFLDYDIWGNATIVRNADTDISHSSGTVTCLTFDTARNFLAQRREAMNGQADCTTTNSADITTTWTRDSALRLTQVTRPDGSCLFYEFDSIGRLQRIKRRDDCNSAASGDKQEFIYDAEGLVTEIDTYDSSSTITAKQLFSYFDSRKLEKIINPVDTSKATAFVYDARGLVSEIDGAGAIGKTIFHRENGPGREGRVTSIDKYYSSTLSDSWSVLYDWSGDQLQVADEDSKSTETLRDDLGRTIRLTSPDMSYPTVFVYDVADRLVTRVDAKGGGSGVQLTHNFTYDNLNRPLDSNYNGACSVTGAGVARPEIQKVYDAPPGGTCPVSGGCLRTGGRLAYVKSTLFCSSTYSSSDGAWDQETFYSYDDAGRVIREDVLYDGLMKSTMSGVQELQAFAWTKLSQLSQMTTGSGIAFGASYNGSSSNSDSDQTDYLWRVNTSSHLIENAKWFPFGPLKQYDQMNQIGGVTQRTRITRNLAYRITNLYLEGTSGSTVNFQTGVTEDAKGRVTSRVYTNGAAGLQSSYFLYDDEDRLLCETTTSVSQCPTSGSSFKNSRQSPYFTAAGDWLVLLRPVPGSTGTVNSFNASGYGTSHQVTSVAQSDGTPTLGTTTFGFDARGNRSYDDNTSTLSNDRRDYLYDGRGNVVNVHGKYYTGSAWHDYDVGSAFDDRNRRVFKFFLDNSTSVQSEWWFYYDPLDRLVEVYYYPNVASLGTYTLFQLAWVEDRLVSFAQTDYPAVTVSKRYVDTDETGRPIEMWSWPASGNATRVWAVDPSAWGFDKNLIGPTIYQPVLFSGQYADTEIAALENDGATVHRPAVALNGFRTYDSFVGSYLQVDPKVGSTWSSYGYTDSNPVGKSDPHGLTSLLNDLTDSWGRPGKGGFGITISFWGDCWDNSDIESLSNCLGNGEDDWGGGGGLWVPSDDRCSEKNCDNYWYDECECTGCLRKCREEATNTVCPSDACSVDSVPKMQCCHNDADSIVLWNTAFHDCYNREQCDLTCRCPIPACSRPNLSTCARFMSGGLFTPGRDWAVGVEMR